MNPYPKIHKGETRHGKLMPRGRTGSVAVACGQRFIPFTRARHTWSSVTCKKCLARWKVDR